MTDFLTIFHLQNLSLDDIIRILGYHKHVLLISKDVIEPKDYAYYIEQMHGRKMPNSDCCPAYFAIGPIGCHPYMPTLLLTGSKHKPSCMYRIEKQEVMKAFPIWD
jgi:hypothetical protein